MKLSARFCRKSSTDAASMMHQVTSLLIVERYQRHPDPNNSIVKLMLAAIDGDLPLEANIVRREVELGRALTDKEIEQEIVEFQSKPRRQAA